MSATDLKAELLRPLVLILAVFAAMGWVLFVLSSWSAASTQRTQRLKLVEATEKAEAASAELARQVQTTGSLSDLQAKVAATRDDLARMSQTRTDVQTELVAAQRSLSSLRRDVSETGRTLQDQRGKLSDLQANAETSAIPASEVQASVKSSRRGRRWSRRGRASRAFTVSRSR